MAAESLSNLVCINKNYPKDAMHDFPIEAMKAEARKGFRSEFEMPELEVLEANLKLLIGGGWLPGRFPCLVPPPPVKGPSG